MIIICYNRLNSENAGIEKAKWSIVRKIGLPRLKETWNRLNLQSKEGRHEWACFAAQQSAEKAVKALHLFLKQEAWGHVVARLLSELPVSVSEDLFDKAKVLDGFYIPTRYANGPPEGAPFQHYGKIQSSEAIRYASEILEFVRSEMA